MKCVVVGIWLCLLATAAAEGQKPRATEAVIRAVLDEQVEAWNKGDLPGFMKGYWKSKDLTFYSGKDKRKGWEETLERYKKRYQGEGKEMGKLSFAELEIQTIGADHAVVKGRWKLEMKKETLEGLFTLIFLKTNDGWRIVHDHTSGP
jgi:ketosteroid isomerase-like protein